MSSLALESSPSPQPLQSAAAEQPMPEPAWITRAADEFGYAWARLSWERASKVPGAWFDAAKADGVVALWPQAFKLTSGRFAGRPFHLRFWQEVIVRLLVGWKEPVEIVDEITGEGTILYVRLFRELRLWIARKNGKSEFLAALALLFWAVEGEVRGQGFCFARDENQARIVFDKMADMIGYAPALAKETRIFAKSLWIQTIKASFKLLSGKAAGKHGRAPTVTVGDEIHEWKDRALADTLRQGEGGSTQPIRLYASTAGLKTQIVGHEIFEQSQQILDGRIDDPTTLVVIFAVPEDADWQDERNWPLANPSIGLSPTLHFLRGEHAKVAGNPRAEAEFRCYHLNQFMEQMQRWLPLRKWDACPGEKDAWKTLPAALEGRECHLAFDSTQSFDPASLCFRFPQSLSPADKVELAGLDAEIAQLLEAEQPIDYKLLLRRRELDTPTFLWKFWLPAETIAARVKSEKVPFDRWRDQGALIEIPGGTFELDWAINATREACRRYKVQKIGFDAWNALEYYNKLVNPQDGADALPEDLFVKMRFGARTLGEATKRFERRVFAGEINHGHHPMARWMAGHCHIRYDDNMNYVPAKRKSEKSIDGIVAAVMDEALAIAVDDSGNIGSDAMAVI
jgi:phage terminase large subunit-like protein